ncbi:MAG: hypothetical protein ACTHQM_13255 [Thermoanaerobaculia bacterium]
MRSLLLVLLLFAARAAAALTYCELLADRAKYADQQIEITAFASFGFEDSTLFDPQCDADDLDVWFEIDENAIRNARMKSFERLLNRKPDAIAHATMRGRFLAGKPVDWNGRTVWMGYGHMGFHSLFVIEEIVLVDSLRAGLDMRARADSPDANCTRLLGGVTRKRAMEQQQEAESGARAWAFDDPLRVATEHLQRISDAAKNVQLRVVRKSESRITYSDARFFVVVSRPYWLSFYANDAKRVAWVVTGANEIGCE